MKIRTEKEYERAIYELLFLRGIMIGQNISDKDLVSDIIRKTTHIYDILSECIQNAQDYPKKEGD